MYIGVIILIIILIIWYRRHHARQQALDPATQKFIDELPVGPPIYTLAIIDARAVLESLQSEPVAIPVDITDIEMGVVGTTSNSLAYSISIIKPRGATGLLPIVMYFHGGGWILGSKRTHGRLVADLATQSKSAVVFVSFTPSPEAQYPAALDQGVAATQFIVANAAQYGLDGTRLAVAGDSVGGNMATTVILKCAKLGLGVRFAYQLLFYPVVDNNLYTPSYRKYAAGPWLTRSAMAWFWNSYIAAPGCAHHDPLICPLRATTAQLSIMPPTMVITGQHDVLRDEGEAYAQRLIEAGVRVTAIRYGGTIHDFVMLNGLKDTPAAISAVAVASAALYKALH